MSSNKLGSIALLLLCALHAVGTRAVAPKNQDSRPSQKQSPAQTVQPAGSCTQTLESERDAWQKPDQVIKAMNLKPGNVVVDLGAGTGYFSRRFAETVGSEGKVIGVDISSAMVRTLIADAKRWGLKNYEARLVPPDDPLLDARSVDVVFVCDTYHHLDERARYFANLRSALRPAGRVVVIDPVKPEGYSNDGEEKRFTKEEVIDEMRKAGYRLARQFDFLLPRQYFLEFEPASAQNQPAND